MTEKHKPILCLDFDGVMHEYKSPWTSINHVSDGPVEGLFEFLYDASRVFDVCVFSSRSAHPSGIEAMKTWLELHAMEWAFKNNDGRIEPVIKSIRWPEKKPAAFLTIDDRALTFTGDWPNPHDLLNFKPWNK